jgi:hypothetical protein
MPKGLPDSWGLYLATKAVKSVRRRGRGGWPSVVFAPLIGPGKAGVAYKFKDVIFYPGKLESLLNSPRGTVGRELHRRALTAQMMAKQQVGKRNGSMAASIYMTHYAHSRGQTIKIGARHSKAFMHHEGTRPHIIRAKNTPNLTFRRGATIVHAPLVRHPGTRPNKFLYTPMKQNFKDLGQIRNRNQMGTKSD